MKLVELNDVDSGLRILINTDHIVCIYPEKRRGVGLVKAGSIVRLSIGNNEYVRVEEEYDTIRSIFERMQ
jgi:hypothetical protein